MNDGLKQRLVGAVVLLAVAVLFLPGLLNRDARRSVDISTQLIEPPPVVEFLDLPEPQAPAQIPPAKPFEENYAQQEPAEPLPAQPVDAAPELDAEGIPSAWSIQVSSFQSAERAEAMLKRLQDEGFKAYIHEAELNGSRIYRVLVGPKINREMAESEKRSIDEKFQVNTLVVKFKP